MAGFEAPRDTATRLRKKYGLEAARVVLGHRSAAVAEVYAGKSYRLRNRSKEANEAASSSEEKPPVAVAAT